MKLQGNSLQLKNSKLMINLEKTENAYPSGTGGPVQFLHMLMSLHFNLINNHNI
jgi:hypothetical protein